MLSISPGQFFHLHWTTGASLMGAVFAYFTITAQGISPIENGQYSASSASPAAITSGIHGTFIVAVIAVVIAIIVGIITLRQQKKITRE